MWTIFSAGRWIFLLTLAGATLPTESKGNKEAVLCYLNNYPSNELQAFSVSEPCCLGAGLMTSKTIIKCVKQKPKKGCNSSNYVVQVEDEKYLCIQSESKWMKKQIDSGKVICE